MKTFFENISVDYIASSIPYNTRNLKFLYRNNTNVNIDKIINTTGISKVAVASKQTTASDLCIASAKKIFNLNKKLIKEIDVIIFVSQSRDYLLPSTSSIIQDKLKLSQNCLALDVPSGCTGYVHGLFLASNMLASNASKKVLLLCGETNSKLINTRDKSVSLIFGDAGSATILSKSRKKYKSYFNFKTNGSGYKDIIIPHGGCRNTINKKSLKIKNYSNGDKRRMCDLKMDGMSVFNFAINIVPKIVLETLEDNKIDTKDVDLFAIHQANKLIINQIIHACQLDPKKTPFVANEYGNTGPASIPTLLSSLKKQKSNYKKVLMCGFGVGLNWGTCLINLSNTRIFKPIIFR